MVTVRHYLKRLPASPWALLFGILLSAATGAALFSLSARTIESDAELRFRSQARIAQYTINAHIKSYTDVVRGAAGLIHANPDITADQFRYYVEHLDLKRNFPGVAVINYAVTITEAQRPEMEQRMRDYLKSLGAPKAARYQIKQREPGSTYTIIEFVEPNHELWLDRIGLDLEARTYARNTLNEARDSNIISASGTRVPMISGPNRYGLAIRMPIYRNGVPISTIEERRAAYIGSVGIGFGINELIEGVVNNLPSKETHLVVRDLAPTNAETGESSGPNVIFDSDYMPGKSAQAREKDDSMIHVALPIELSRRKWEADFSISRRALHSDFDFYLPWLAGFAGFMTTALLYALFQTMASSRRHAMQIAEEMTKELRTSKAKLQTSHETLRKLAAHTEHIKEGERKRIAREIHDQLGQNLLALRIDAEMLSSRTCDSHGRLHARAEATVRQIDDTIRCVRQIINDLRPNVLDLGLNAAVDWSVQDFQRRTGIACYVIEDEIEPHVDDHCATALFRILQESLNNISRHARATEVHVVLHVREDVLTMSISDNGIGLQPGSRNRQGSFGLVGIEERVNILGGTFSIDSSPGAGTTLEVKVPINAPPGPERGVRTTVSAVEALPA